MSTFLQGLLRSTYKILEGSYINIGLNVNDVERDQTPDIHGLGKCIESEYKINSNVCDCLLREY